MRYSGGFEILTCKISIEARAFKSRFRDPCGRPRKSPEPDKVVELRLPKLGSKTCFKWLSDIFR